MTVFLDLLWSIGLIAHASFFVSGITLKLFHRSGWVNNVWYFTRWPTLFYIFFNPVYLTITADFAWWHPISTGIDFYCWWLYRDAGDDDTGDKLKEKITEKIEEINGRLVVTPA